MLLTHQSSEAPAVPRGLSRWGMEALSPSRPGAASSTPAFSRALLTVFWVCECGRPGAYGLLGSLLGCFPLCKKKACFEERQGAASRGARGDAPRPRAGGRLRGGRGSRRGGRRTCCFSCCKRTQSEVGRAGCQQAGRPRRAPPLSLRAPSRPAPSLQVAAGSSHPRPCRPRRDR